LWRGSTGMERGLRTGKDGWTKMKKAAYRKRKESWRGWRKACLEN
jgi:hypothetical protein